MEHPGLRKRGCPSCDFKVGFVASIAGDLLDFATEISLSLGTISMVPYPWLVAMVFHRCLLFEPYQISSVKAFIHLDDS